MKTIDLLIGAGVLAVGYIGYKMISKPKLTNTPSINPALLPGGVFDGTNWGGTMSQRLSAMDLIVPGFLNFGGGVNAVPSQNGKAAVGMNLLSNWQGNV